jgi:hypothetical protein
VVESAIRSSPGSRRAEVLGLEVKDVSFDRKTIRFGGNQARSDSGNSPTYAFNRDRPPTRLLFPPFHQGGEASSPAFGRWSTGLAYPRAGRGVVSPPRCSGTPTAPRDSKRSIVLRP